VDGHRWWTNNWIDFTLVFWEEKPFDPEIEQFWSDLWSVLNRPVKLHVGVNLSLSLAFSDFIVQHLRNLVQECIVELFGDFISDGSHEQIFENVD